MRAGEERAPARVVNEWLIGPRASITADGDSVQFVIRHEGVEVHADLSNVEQVVRAVRAARSWNDAVFPPGSRLLRDDPPVLRARAWLALTDAGHDRPNAVVVNEFLAAWRVQPADVQVHMEEYAAEWRKLRYG